MFETGDAGVAGGLAVDEGVCGIGGFRDDDISGEEMDIARFLGAGLAGQDFGQRRTGLAERGLLPVASVCSPAALER